MIVGVRCDNGKKRIFICKSPVNAMWRYRAYFGDFEYRIFAEKLTSFKSIMSFLKRPY